MTTIRQTRARRSPRTARAVAAIAMVMAVAGCGIVPVASSSSQPLMTPAQALAYDMKILNQTVGVMQPRPRLEPTEFFNGISGCTSDNPGNLAVAGRSFWLRGIKVSDNKAIGEQVLRYWKHQHWVITGTNGIGTNEPTINAVAPPYAVSISLESNAYNWLSIGDASVCLPPGPSASPGQ